MLLKVFLIVLSSTLLISCARKDAPIQTQIEFIEKDIPIQERPRQVELQDVTFYVVTADNLDEFIEKFQNENGVLVFYAISVRGYESMALNIEELRRYILQSGSLITYYENSINGEI